MLTLRFGSAASRHRKSYARRAANTEYVEANGTMPVSARPAAAPKSSCSAMPIWKKRSGKAWAKMCMSVYLPRSAVSPTILSFSCAALTRACPNGAAHLRVAEDHGGTSDGGRLGGCVVESGQQRADVVPVHALGVPAKRLPLFGDGLGTQH